MIPTGQTKKRDRLKRLSLAPVDPDDALRGAMQVSPPEAPKKTKKKRKTRKKATKKRKA